MDTNKPPLYYNLGAITRETGLHPDTLRAWERRYDLPQPTRSEGGQRLYSQRDLEILRWLISKQETGLRISQAVELYRTQVEAGIDPLEEERRIAQTAPRPVVAGKNLTAYRDTWLEAALRYDGAKADQVLSEAFSLFSPETVCFEVMFAGLSEIGERWYHSEATVQQEHYASALVTRRLNALIAGAPLPTRPTRIVIAAPQEEDHILAALLMTFLLRRRGYEVVYLGADVPVENFSATIRELQPDLVILTAHLLLTAASLLALANELAGLSTRLAYGGPIFVRVPELRKTIPGSFLGENLTSVIPTIETILATPKDKLQASQPDIPPYLEDLILKMPEIESRMNDSLKTYPVILSAPNHYISRYILAAVQLGDIAYLSADLEWAYGLIANFKMPTGMMVEFLQDYARSIETVMGSQAAPLSDWLYQGAKEIESNGSGDNEGASS